MAVQNKSPKQRCLVLVRVMPDAVHEMSAEPTGYIFIRKSRGLTTYLSLPGAHMTRCGEQPSEAIARILQSQTRLSAKPEAFQFVGDFLTTKLTHLFTVNIPVSEIPWLDEGREDFMPLYLKQIEFQSAFTEGRLKISHYQYLIDARLFSPPEQVAA
ncbi:MAG: hypothetical protein ACM3TU_02360 [Bacillota bacterium]